MKNLYNLCLTIYGVPIYAMIDADTPMAAKRMMDRVNEALEDALIHASIGEFFCDAEEWMESAEEDGGDWRGRADPAPLLTFEDPTEEGRVIFQREDGTYIAEVCKDKPAWDLGTVNSDEMTDGEYRTITDWLEARNG